MLFIILSCIIFQLQDHFWRAQIIADDSVSGGENVNVKIAWSNNTPSKINDAVIIAEVTGDGFWINQLLQRRFYDSYNNKIVWDKIHYLLYLRLGLEQMVLFLFLFEQKHL